MKTTEEQQNYYADQIRKAAKDHNTEFPLTIKIFGSVNETNRMPLPSELALIIKDWYFLHGDKISQ